MYIQSGCAPTVLDTKTQANKITNLTTDQLVTYLDSFHGTDHQNSLHYPGAKPTQQAFGALKSTGLILCMVAEELKHPKPEEGNRASKELWDKLTEGCIIKIYYCRFLYY